MVTGEACDCSGNLCTDDEFCYNEACNKSNYNIKIESFVHVSHFGGKYSKLPYRGGGGSHHSKSYMWATLKVSVF